MSVHLRRLAMFLIAASFSFLFLSPTVAKPKLPVLTPESVLVVNAIGDASDALPGDGVCDTGVGACTLRAALEEANALLGADMITFAITGGNTLITPLAPLPVITDAVYLDGTSQAGARCATMFGSPMLLIEINGTNAGALTDGLVFGEGSDGSVINGLVVNRFGGSGIVLASGNNTVTCSFVGTNRGASAAAGNGHVGIRVDTGDGNVIGGNTRAARNVISGNVASGVYIGLPAEEEPLWSINDDDPVLDPPTATVVAGNYIGTSAAGVLAVPNGADGVTILGVDVIDNVISGNLISGNTANGIALFEGARLTMIHENTIGTNVLGVWELPNGGHGILIENSADNTIAHNLLSGNTLSGIAIADPPSSIASTGNVAIDNLIGTNIDGDAALPNGATGVTIQNASFNTIGGFEAGEGNVISGNTADGVTVTASPNFDALQNTIAGNHIGVAADGLTPLGNGSAGVNLFGCEETLVQDNLIGANAAGVAMSGPFTSGNIILGNYIGTDPTGTIAWGNGEHGVFLNSRTYNNQIGGIGEGEGNVIAMHSGRGIWATAVGTEGNAIRGNSIYDNQGTEIENKLGIDLAGSGVNPNDIGDVDDGPNKLQNYPILLGTYTFDNAFVINAHLNSAPNTTYEVDLFLNETCDASGYGEGEVYIGTFTITSNAFGNAGLTQVLNTLDMSKPFLTATATDPYGNTSEFSNCVQFKDALVVNATDDVDDGTCNLAHCTLREALNAANAGGEEALVAFSLAGDGPHTISPTVALPLVTVPLTIDGLSQPGASCLADVPQPPLPGVPQPLDTEPPPQAPASLMIELNGTLAGAGVDGLTLTAGNTLVRGLAINRFDGHGLVLDGGDGYAVNCNALGVDPGATLPLGNGGSGLVINNSATNVIGEPPPAENTIASGDPVVLQPTLGNIIAANGGDGVTVNGVASADNLILGNVIGLDRTATIPLGNGLHGVTLNGAVSTTIGDIAEHTLNVIGANGGHGLYLVDATDVMLHGNMIGVDALGTSAFGNGGDGVLAENVVGLTLMQNVVSGNAGNGMTLDMFTVGTSVTQNVFGTDAWGLSMLGNGGHGVALYGDHATIADNLLFYNGGTGIVVDGVTALDNDIGNNRFYGNVELGIDLGGDGVTANDPGDADVGPNAIQNYPMLEDVAGDAVSTTITGTLDSAADTTFTLRFYMNPYCDASGCGEGHTLLGDALVTTGPDGLAPFVVTLPVELPAGVFVSATATDPLGNTSEFAPCVPDPGTFAGVQMAPEVAAQTVDPGASAVYVFTLMNMGNVPDMFLLSASGIWNATLSDMATPLLQPGDTATFTVTVDVPVDALAGATDSTFVLAQSTYDDMVVGSAQATTTAATVVAVGVTPDAASRLWLPGRNVRYMLTVTNQGNGPDSFTVSGDGLWPFLIDPPATATLLPGESAQIMVRVSIPEDAAGQSDVTTITIRSAVDNAVTATAELTTSAYNIVIGPPIVGPPIVEPH